MQEVIFYIAAAIGLVIYRLPDKKKEAILWFPFELSGNIGFWLIFVLPSKIIKSTPHLWKIITGLFRKR